MSTGIGEALQSAREDQGRSLEDVSRSTRVRTDYLRALEEERFDVFGGDIYAKGFLKTYANDLGIDPQPLLEKFRREVAHDELRASALAGGPVSSRGTRGAPRPWIAWLLVAVIVVAGLGFLGTLGSGRAPQTASDEPLGPPPQPATEPDTGAEATPEPEPEPTEPEPEPAIEGVELLLAFEENCWVDVRIDGTPHETGTIEAGQTRQYRADQEIVIRFGNPGGVRVELNGENLGPPGQRGVPRTLTFTPDGMFEA